MPHTNCVECEKFLPSESIRGITVGASAYWNSMCSDCQSNFNKTYQPKKEKQFNVDTPKLWRRIESAIEEKARCSHCKGRGTTVIGIDQGDPFYECQICKGTGCKHNITYIIRRCFRVL